MSGERRFQPVTVAVGNPHVVVSDARQAAECLLTQWPKERGPRHRDAVDACLKVLDGHRSSVDARDALIAAAQESNILIAA